MPFWGLRFLEHDTLERPTSVLGSGVACPHTHTDSCPCKCQNPFASFWFKEVTGLKIMGLDSVNRPSLFVCPFGEEMGAVCPREGTHQLVTPETGLDL